MIKDEVTIKLMEALGNLIHEISRANRTGDQVDTDIIERARTTFIDASWDLWPELNDCDRDALARVKDR